MAAEAFTKALETTRELQLTVTGRRTGREISNPVWFAREGDTLYLVPVRGTDTDWYRNLLKAPVEHVLDLFRARYGARDVAAYYPKQDAAMEVPLTCTAPRPLVIRAPI